jgi:hypothetical protein
MSSQPFVYGGFYLQYENRLYRIINLAFNNNTENFSDTMVIYQPQYNSPEFGKDILYALEMNSFLEDINIGNMIVPKFKHLGNTRDAVTQNIRDNNIKIKPKPIFKKESILSQNIDELVADHYVLKGFAKHAETKETQIIYAWNNTSILSIISKNKFFEKTRLDPSNKIIAKYLNELE